MHDAKLVKIFKSFSNDEFKHLRKFTQSDFFNTDQHLVLLFDAMSKYYPDFAAKGMKKETLYAKVFSSQPYNDAKWRNLIFKMNKLVEDYLIWLELKQAETTRLKLLTIAFGKRNLYQKFEKSTLTLSEKLAEQSIEAADALKERMQANLQFYHHPQTAKVDNLDKLLSALDDLDHYYFAEKLRLACDLKVAENMVAGRVPVLLITEISQLVQQAQVRELDYLKIYERILDLLTQHPTMAAFEETFEFFLKMVSRLSGTDKQFGLLHLLNFAINQVNKGETGYQPLVLRLYKLGLDQGVLISEGKISDTTFSNIASTASALKEFEWTKNFILQYEKYLSPEVQEETTTLSFGYLYFHQNDYVKAVEKLQFFTSQHINKVLSSKNLLLRCYFELSLKDSSYFTVFTSFANAYDKFIKREKQLSATRKTWYKNLISTMVSLARHKNERSWNKEVKSKIAVEVTAKPMYLKAWLMERIERM